MLSFGLRRRDSTGIVPGATGCRLSTAVVGLRERESDVQSGVSMRRHGSPRRATPKRSGAVDLDDQAAAVAAVALSHRSRVLSVPPRAEPHSGPTSPSSTGHLHPRIEATADSLSLRQRDSGWDEPLRPAVHAGQVRNRRRSVADRGRLLHRGNSLGASGRRADQREGRRFNRSSTFPTAPIYDFSNPDVQCFTLNESGAASPT